MIVIKKGCVRVVNQKRLVEEFLELVKIDSESKNEMQMVKILMEKFKVLNVEVFEDDSKERTGQLAGNLICTLKGSDSSISPIYFTCHMDTVTPGKGVKPVIKDDIIMTDGTTVLGADDKAGIASILEVVKVLKEKQISHGDIQFILTVSEEIGLVGSQAINPNLLNAEFGYAIDSGGTVGDIIVAAPTQSKITAEIFGKKAHAGVEPEKGISAITIASKAISKMPLGRIDDELTANIGIFKGGTATNIVCDYVEIIAEARALVSEKMENQSKLMKEIFEETALEMGGHADVSIEVLYAGYKLGEGDKVVEIAQRAAKRIGRHGNLLQSGGGSDANIFSGFGIPTVNLAVGYEDIHTTDEKMPIAELVKVAEMVIAIIEETAKK